MRRCYSDLSRNQAVEREAIRLLTVGNHTNLRSGIALPALSFTTTLYYQLVRGYDTQIARLPLIQLELTSSP